jgi:3'(2'), 5'-bisphosphate nucleotidase
VQPIIEQAREAVLAVYESGRFLTEEKSDHSPVTAADRASHAILLEGLERLDGHVPVISEESRERDKVADATPFWLVDPLDGTKEFLRRSGEFTINVALVGGDGQPVWGLVDVPLYGRTYFGGEGRAFYQDQTGVHPLGMLSPITEFEAVRVALSRSHLGTAEDWLKSHQVVVRSTVYAGSAVKFCWVAEGRVDLYVRLRPTMGWDTAAGQAIVEAVGGYVRHAETGEPLTYRPHAEVNPSFVASRPYTVERKKSDI